MRTACVYCKTKGPDAANMEEALAIGLSHIEICDKNPMKAEIAALRARIAELESHLAACKAECRIAREWNKLRNSKRGTGVLSDWQRRLSKARAATDAAGGVS